MLITTNKWLVGVGTMSVAEFSIHESRSMLMERTKVRAVPTRCLAVFGSLVACPGSIFSKCEFLVLPTHSANSFNPSSLNQHSPKARLPLLPFQPHRRVQPGHHHRFAHCCPGKTSPTQSLDIAVDISERHGMAIGCVFVFNSFLLLALQISRLNFISGR